MPTKAKTVKPVAAIPDAQKVVASGAAKKPRAAAKPAATSIAASPARPAPAAVAPSISDTISKVSTSITLNKRELIDKIVTATGAKKNLVRDVVEATLAVLGDALSKGTTLNLPPFGKAKVSRPSDDTGRAMTIKLRRGLGGGIGAAKAKQSLADAED
jgi:nucleoid DNA-binding protein